MIFKVGVKITQEDIKCTVLLEGDIDHHNARFMRQSIDDYISKNHPKVLCLDFSRIKFMDSSGIGLIMGRFKFIKLLGGELEVVGASNSIKKIIKLSGLESLGIIKK
ncbi:MAG: anti-sigma factor antagonist [Oscillospiraceae bacterium]|nr:anti-sigma factor antagonist [Oscillospiraceae bacterium]